MRCARFSCDCKFVWLTDGRLLSLFSVIDSRMVVSFNSDSTPLSSTLIPSNPSFCLSSLQDFVVSSSMSCIMFSLKAAFFAMHASVFRVLFDESPSCICQVDTILSKLQPFTCLNIDSTDSFLAAASKDGTITIYDINSQIVLIELSGHGDGSCTVFRFSPNMVDAVSSSDKGQLLVSVVRLAHVRLFYFVEFTDVAGMEHWILDKKICISNLAGLHN